MTNPRGPSDFVDGELGRGEPGHLADDRGHAAVGSGLRGHSELPLPERLTPHGSRRTFAALVVANGDDPRYVMAQLGHTEPHFTLLDAGLHM